MTVTREALAKSLRLGLGALTISGACAFLIPGPEACPKCMGASPPQTLTAYLLTVLLLSILPLGMFATLVYAVRKQLKAPPSPPDRSTQEAQPPPSR